MRTLPGKPNATTASQTIWMADKVVQTPIANLKPFSNNNRVHTAKSTAKLKASVAQFGFVTPICPSSEFLGQMAA